MKKISLMTLYGEKWRFASVEGIRHQVQVQNQTSWNHDNICMLNHFLSQDPILLLLFLYLWRLLFFLLEWIIFVTWVFILALNFLFLIVFLLYLDRLKFIWWLLTFEESLVDLSMEELPYTLCIRSNYGLFCLEKLVEVELSLYWEVKWSGTFFSCNCWPITFLNEPYFICSKEFLSMLSFSQIFFHIRCAFVSKQSFHELIKWH